MAPRALTALLTSKGSPLARSLPLYCGSYLAPKAISNWFGASDDTSTEIRFYGRGSGATTGIRKSDKQYSDNGFTTPDSMACQRTKWSRLPARVPNGSRSIINRLRGELTSGGVCFTFFIFGGGGVSQYQCHYHSGLSLDLISQRELCNFERIDWLPMKRFVL